MCGNAKIVESSETLATIRELKQRGFRISLDDFGAGYSNLSYLKNIPATMIKLDKSLIQDIKTDQDSRTIVESIISMLHKLNYDVLPRALKIKKRWTTSPSLVAMRFRAIISRARSRQKILLGG